MTMQMLSMLERLLAVIFDAALMLFGAGMALLIEDAARRAAKARREREQRSLRLAIDRRMRWTAKHGAGMLPGAREPRGGAQGWEA